MKGKYLPPVYELKLERIEKELKSGQASPAKYKGRKLKRFPGLVSVPLGRRYRAVFRKATNGYVLVEAMSHEAYNNMNFA